MSPPFRTTTLAGLLLACAATAQGGCLDQSFVPAQLTNGLEVTANQPVTQTFTVGQTGTLTRVEISRINHHRGTPTQPLQVDIVATDPSGVPTAVVLAGVTLQPSSVPASRGPLPIDLLAFNVQVQAGQVLGIALSTAAPGGGSTYAWSGEAPGGSYAQGQVFIQQMTPLAVWDLAFQTWVLTAASTANYGAGHPGTNGVPALTSSGNPVIGTVPSLLLGNSSPSGTLGALAFGLLRANVPTPFGGTALVQFITMVALPLPPGGGQLALSLPNDPNLCGVVVDVQGVLIDGGASHGIAFTPGLELVIGG